MNGVVRSISSNSLGGINLQRNEGHTRILYGQDQLKHKSSPAPPRYVNAVLDQNMNQYCHSSRKMSKLSNLSCVGRQNNPKSYLASMLWNSIVVGSAIYIGGHFLLAVANWFEWHSMIRLLKHYECQIFHFHLI